MYEEGRSADARTRRRRGPRRERQGDTSERGRSAGQHVLSLEEPLVGLRERLELENRHTRIDLSDDVAYQRPTQVSARAEVPVARWRVE